MAGGLFVLVVIAVGVFFLVGPRGQVVTPEDRDEAEAMRENYDQGDIAGGVTDTPEGEVIDSLQGSIALLDYDYNRQSDQIRGSVLNNSSQPYVNVQVGFRLLDAGGEVVGTVADTLSEIGPGESRRFSIGLPLDQPVTSIMPTVLRAQRRDVVGRQADPAYQQNDSLRIEE